MMQICSKKHYTHQQEVPVGRAYDCVWPVYLVESSIMGGSKGGSQGSRDPPPAKIMGVTTLL